MNALMINAVQSCSRAIKFCETWDIKDVLDIACGTGRHVFGLANRGYKCTGQDYTHERIKIAKDRAKHEGTSIRLLQGDATR
jgi:ubiquinone/menaquinone biosynthesis C-methylase UbiE